MRAGYSDLLGWNTLQDYYFLARAKALHRVYPSQFPDPDGKTNEEEFKVALAL